MNTGLLIFSIIVTVAMIFAVYCGIKLYDISSSFVPALRYGALPLGILVSIIAVVVCARPTIEEEVDITVPATTMMVSAIGMMIFGFICSIINDRVSKRDPEKESLSFAGPFILDLLGGLITAGAVACSFAMGSSFAMVAATAIALFLIKEKVALIFRYKDEWSRGKVILDVALPLILIVPASAGMTFLFAKDPMFDANMLAITCGYLVYHSAFHAYFIAKSFKK